GAEWSGRGGSRQDRRRSAQTQLVAPPVAPILHHGRDSPRTARPRDRDDGRRLAEGGSRGTGPPGRVRPRADAGARKYRSRPLTRAGTVRALKPWSPPPASWSALWPRRPAASFR